MTKSPALPRQAQPCRRRPKNRPRLSARRTLVLYPYFKTARFNPRQPEARLEEAVGLAHAIRLEVADSMVVPVSDPKPSTLMGSGKVEEIKALIAAHDVQLVIVDSALSPVQQRNLENAWGCKVIDRTALILEIFGARARTAEGKLQVELAALNYQKTRLVRSWTHLERQRGGFGFLGGPGESQIEIDRRLIRDRISRIKKELEQVVRTRALHREKRRSVPYPVIALVGYTNAGKSTLFNRLTGAGVMAADVLFATLDPTMRALRLPSGAMVILSDTVGFISDLPTELVAAFRATLEEVLEADFLLHVRDVAHDDSEVQKADVEAVLRALFDRETLPENVIEVFNKVDLLPPGQRAILPPEALHISALTGEGVDELLADLDRRLAAAFFTRVAFTLPAAQGKALSWLHRNGNVLSKELEEDTLHVQVMMSEENIHRFEKLFSLTGRR